MRTIRTGLTFLLTLIALTSVAQLPDSLINFIDIDDKKDNSINISVGKGSTNINFIDLKWLFIDHDSPELKNGTRDERKYLLVHGNSSLFSEDDKRKGIILTPHDRPQSIFDKDFNGVAWYKCYFKFSKELINKIYELEFMMHGACEIYLDGNLKERVGNVSHDPKLAEALNVTNGNIYFHVSDTSVHCFAIRFGLLNHKEYLSKYGDILHEPLFTLSMPEIKENNRTVVGVLYSVTNMLTAFFFSLFLIHILIYIFYREQNFNLLYSLFLILLSLTFLELYLTQFIKDLKFYLWLESIDDVIFPTVCFILVTLLNKLLNEKRSWHYIAFSIFLLYHYIDVIFIGEFHSYSYVTIVMYTYFNTLAHSIKGIRRKIVSAKFLAWGILSCTISFVLLIVVTVFITLAYINVNNQPWVLFLNGFFIVTAILSIPISMSAYLAYDFANTNRSLTRKLIEVEDLSAKNIEQEKERQRILAEQNEMLEHQVEERTKEINEQKKVIEEKNKDITDSINYAQRIQRSILPTSEEIAGIFKENFVLFKPRDIVSGDFYQFKKKGDWHYAILADCTGHGVPGALMSMIGSNLLKQIILERGVTEPNKILAELHKEVRITLRQTSGVTSHDGMDAAILMRNGNKLFIASANRPVYIIRNGELTELKPDKRSIGGSSVGDDVTFNLNEVNTEPGMMIYLFSDGYADQFGGEQGKKFKVKNLSQLLLSISSKPLEVQKEILETTFDNWKKDLEQVDDVSLVGLRF